MKKVVYMLVLVVIMLLVYYNRNTLADLMFSFEENYKETSTIINNEYSKDKSYGYVKLTNNFIATNEQDILNIIYTILNSGMNDFTFYCDEKYSNCMDAIDRISKDRVVLSNINNYVHPFNSFTDIETTRYPTTGKVTIHINHLYESEKIKEINYKINEIIINNIKNDMSKENKIKAIHDYIINNTKYDNLKSEENISKYSSDTAYGPLFEGYAICNGYSDLMNVFLHKLGINSIKISSENHIWNLVYLDNSWYHLDLTWDDPVMENGKDIIDYSYFLISTEELLELEDNQHFFDKDIYNEA